jgi:hypothetical protein
VSARYVAARSARCVNGAPVARRSQSALARRVGRASGALGRVVLLALVLALSCAAPAASDVYVTNQNSRSVSQYDVDADGALTASDTVSAGFAPAGLAVSPDGRNVYVADSGSELDSDRAPGAVSQ